MFFESMVTNPIGWAQMKLLGGPKRIMAICGVYAGVMLVINIVFYRGIGGGPSGMPLNAFAGGSLTVTMFLTAGLLLLVGAGALKKAVHRDFTSEMITSHRTTAMTGNIAVLGYLTGPTSTILCLTVVNWIACMILAMLAGYPIIAPTAIFLVLGCMVAMLWPFAVLVALATRGATSVAGPLVVLMIVSSAQGIFLAYPGLALLVGFTTLSDLPTVSATGIVDYSIVVSMCSQLVLGAIFFMAASRKYLRDDVPAFTPVLAYTLLAACTLISAIALRFWHDPTMGFAIPTFTDTRLQSIVTLTALLLLALLPVASSARFSARWAARKAKDPAFDGPKPRPFIEAPIIATLLVFAILLAVIGTQMLSIFDFHGASLLDMPGATMLDMPGATMLAFGLALLAVAGLLRYTYSVTERAVWVLLLFLVLFLAMPPLADFSLEAIQDRHAYAPKSWLFGCSPVGTWILTCTRAQGPILPGLVVQAVIGAMTLLLVRKAKY